VVTASFAIFAWVAARGRSPLQEIFWTKSLSAFINRVPWKRFAARRRKAMLQFTDLVRGGEAVRDIKQKYPETAPVFDQFGLRPSCDDCSIEMAARKVGASFEDLLVEVNKSIYKNRGVTARAS
jgi:hypothetical protein